MQNKIEEASIQLGHWLVQHQGLLTTAESCTGGLLAGAVTAVAGSSAWFDRGWVTYSNDAKLQELAVPAEALTAFGAVSEEVACAMAQGALAQAPSAMLALSTTGIAGPGGGTADKPVGLVCFGFARRTKDRAVQVRSITKVFEGDRHAVRQATVLFSLRTACAWLSQG
jgi:nicotinamide-nucleotide amidase